MPHRSLLVVVFAGSVTSCGGDEDGPDDNADGTTDEVPTFVFNERIPAEEFDSSIAASALVAHQVGNMLLASTSVVVADEKVQDRLNIEGAGGDTLRAGGLDCWTRDAFPMFSFPIDYSGCANYDMAGGVYVADHPTGPLLFEFQNFQIIDRTIGGVIGFDRRGAFADPLYWQVYDTDSSNPGLENRVQIGVTLDDGTYGISWLGGASVDFLSQEWSMWGAMSLAVGAETIEVIYGGLDASDVPPDDPPGADVLKSSLNWLECRCPQSGIGAMELPLHLETVTFDVDALETEPDGIDDPLIEIDIDQDIAGSAVLTWTGCGSWDVAYTTTAAEIPVSVAQLQGVLSSQCELFAIVDQPEGRCANIVAAAGALPSGLIVEISAAEVTESAKAAADGEFDTAWCHLY